MAKRLLSKLRRGVEFWNDWRKDHPVTCLDLSAVNLERAVLYGVDLEGANLEAANLRRADLRNANLRKANLCKADLSGARLSKAQLQDAVLESANLRRAKLDGANLYEANLWSANLSCANLENSNLVHALLLDTDCRNANFRLSNLAGANLFLGNFRKANLSEVDLQFACLAHADLSGAKLDGSWVYGTAIWDVKLENTSQRNLIINHMDYVELKEPMITVDNIEVAQFLHLLLHNEKIRGIIDTISSKLVLILGRFSDERKVVLDALRDELRKRDYLPVLFDFARPANRDTLETVSTLAHMVRFIIADITDARSVPQELQSIIPNLTTVPVQPVLQRNSSKYGLFEHFGSYPWVLKTFRYRDTAHILASIGPSIIRPAEQRLKRLRR